MSWEAWTTLGVTGGMVLAMVMNLASPDLVLMAGLTLLLITGILDPQQAFAGFSNQGMLTVAALFVVAAGVRDTGGLDFAMRRMLGHPRRLFTAQLRMMLPVSVSSAFMNNTPIVAMTVPVVMDWARRIGQHPGKLLIPLSYASIVGGTCTLIGTSTNLVIYGLAVDRWPDIDVGLFEIAYVGLPVMVAAMLYMLLASHWLLPARGEAARSFANMREYTVPLRVEPDSPVVGLTIEEAGLRQLPGLFLAEIERHDGEVRPAPGPRVRLRARDRLLFTGVIDSVVDLRKIRGLVPAEDQADKLVEPRPNRRLVEAVIGPASPLCDKSVRETGFRTRYNAVILAVHRQGERIASKVGDIELRGGDTLLLETHPGFVDDFKHDGAFALVSEVANSSPPRHERSWVAIALLLGMVVLSATGVLPLLVSALLAAGGMVATRCLRGDEARRSLDVRVLLTIAAAFGVGHALDSTGAADHIAQQVVALAQPFGALGLLSAIYLTTAVLTALITNNAAAVLMFPIAASAAASVQLDFRPFMFTLMLAASANFMTPIGYQTNLMVYGPGRYRFADFVRFGLPLQLLLAGVTVGVVWLVWL